MIPLEGNFELRVLRIVHGTVERRCSTSFNMSLGGVAVRVAWYHIPFMHKV